MLPADGASSTSHHSAPGMLNEDRCTVWLTVRGTPLVGVAANSPPQGSGRAKGGRGEMLLIIWSAGCSSPHSSGISSSGRNPQPK